MIWEFVWRLVLAAIFGPGRILDCNGLSERRYLDDFDYVAFLNDGTIRAQNPPPHTQKSSDLSPVD